MLPCLQLTAGILLVAFLCVPVSSDILGSGLSSGSSVNTDIVLGFETDRYSVAEGGEVEVCVVLFSGSLPLGITVTVSVESTEGATPGVDFDDYLYRYSTSISFFIGDQADLKDPQCFRVQTSEDSILEGPEAFSLGLDLYYDEDEYRFALEMYGVTITTNNKEAQVIITDNDIISIGFEQPSYTYPVSRGSVSACLQILDGAEEAIERYFTVRVMIEEEETGSETALSAPRLQLVSFHIGDRTGSTRCVTFNTGATSSVEEPSFQLSVVVQDIAVDIAQGRDSAHISTLNDLCPVLADPEGGDVTWTGLAPGSEATYSCNDGLVLTSDASRECLEGGIWSGVEPMCIVACPELESPVNGIVSLTGLAVGSVATYSCDGYLAPTVNQPRQCRQDGTWSGEKPMCIELKLYFTNNSPVVDGSIVRVYFTSTVPLDFAECRIIDQGVPLIEDCTSGFAEFTFVSPKIGRNPHVLVVEANAGSASAALQTRFLTDDSSNCAVHLINRGVVVGPEQGTVRVEFQGTGTTEDFIPTCVLRSAGVGTIRRACDSSSLHTITGLDPGDYTLAIRPPLEACTGRIGLSVEFSVLNLGSPVY